MRVFWHLITVANFGLVAILLALDWSASQVSHWSTVAVAVVGCIYVAIYFENEAVRAAILQRQGRR